MSQCNKLLSQKKKNSSLNLLIRVTRYKKITFMLAQRLCTFNPSGLISELTAWLVKTKLMRKHNVQG